MQRSKNGWPVVRTIGIRLAGVGLLIALGLWHPRLSHSAQISPGVPVGTAGAVNATATPSPTITVTPSPTPLYNPGSVGSIEVGQIQNAGVVPVDGRLMFQATRSFVSASSIGYSFLGVGKSQGAQNFALGFQVDVQSQSKDSGCGVTFYATAADFHSILITPAGHLLITHQSQANQTIILDQPVPQFMDHLSQHSVLLTAIDNTFTIYVNGYLITTVPNDGKQASSGTFAMEVFNPSANNLITYCSYANLWAWSFDPATPTPTATATIAPTETVTPTLTATPAGA